MSRTSHTPIYLSPLLPSPLWPRCRIHFVASKYFVPHRTPSIPLKSPSAATVSSPPTSVTAPSVVWMILACCYKKKAGIFCFALCSIFAGFGSVWKFDTLSKKTKKFSDLDKLSLVRIEVLKRLQSQT